MNDEMQDRGFPLTALREIKYLSQLNHPNIVSIKQVLNSKPCESNGHRGSYFLLFDYLNFDLIGLRNKNILLTVPQLKCIMQQLLRGLVYLHKDKWICHRDIKGANILLSKSGEVRITDFGLARVLNPMVSTNNYTTRVVTLWYRSHELLLGKRDYDFGVDIWSLACVFIELVTGFVIFQANDELNAIKKIWSVLGTVNAQNMPGFAQLRNYHGFN